MKTAPEACVVYVLAGKELVILRPGGNTIKISLSEIAGRVLGSKYYILVGTTTETAYPTKTPQTSPVLYKP